MGISAGFLEELRARLPASAVVGRRVKLTRKGREFAACCPFHKEKTPSFYVNDDKGFFHCFGCGAHGDIIGFVMQFDRVEFREAVERLAGEAGLSVPVESEAERRRDEQAKGLGELVEAAALFFEAELKRPAGRDAMAYLSGRGLGERTIASFRLGFAPPDAQALIKAMAAEGFGVDQMVEAGLARVPEDGREPYSFFRNRIMFPVADKRGRLVAFGARLISGDGPKYINSPDTPLFHKGRMLYGLDRARAAARSGRRPIVVEGYMDVIALVEAGHDGAVAPLGTALTEDQIRELWALGQAVGDDVFAPLVCFDGDAAGQRAASRAVHRALPLLVPGRSLKIAFLPEGDDPDSLIRREGLAGFDRAVSRPLTPADIVWSEEAQGRRIATADDMAALKRRLVEVADTIAEPEVRKAYVSDLLGRAFRLIRDVQRGRVATAARGRIEATPVSARDFRSKAEGLLVALAVAAPQVAARVRQALEALRFHNLEAETVLFTVLMMLDDDPAIAPETLRLKLAEQGHGAILDALDGEIRRQGLPLSGPDGEAVVERAFRGVLQRFYRAGLVEQLRELKLRPAEARAEDHWTKVRALQDLIAEADAEIGEAGG